MIPYASNLGVEGDGSVKGVYRTRTGRYPRDRDPSSLRTMEMTTDPTASHDAEFDALVERTEGLQPWRRVFHAANGLLLAFGPALMGWSRATTLGVLTGALVLLVALDVARLRAGALNRLFFRLFGHLASPREAAGIASSTWYALGALVAYAIYPPAVAVAAILVLGLADPAAGVVGRIWGRRRIGKGTLEGTATFWIVGTLVLAPLFGWPVALLAAGVAAVAEILPGLIDDNLVIPVITGAVLWLSSAQTSASSFPF